MNIPVFPRLTLLALTLLALTASPAQAQREKLPPDDLEYVEKKWPDAKRTYTGLRYIVLKKAEKDSPSPTAGSMVKVLYKGMLLDGTVFDQGLDRAHALDTRVGRGELIEGWDEALQKMHKGEKWLLIVPPEMAYGSKGKPPGIPRNATLVFEMELLDISAN